MADMAAIAENLISGKKDEVASLVQAAIDEGVDAGTILNDGLVVHREPDLACRCECEKVAMEMASR